MSQDKYNELAFPMYSEVGNLESTGMTLRDYFASKPSIKFTELDKEAQHAIGGWNPSAGSSEFVSGTKDMKYLEWLAECSAKWNYMQADANLKARK